EDFRPGLLEGVRLSKEWGIYRQQYCGCLLSEFERYKRLLPAG
ncbi:MAG: epoxyqueuosine reductase QueH, partial [Humidesulfovibrio sp.]|nr:epoxyqueuosine reductase QueH [Humidesulfovibrio sp.]